MRPKRIKILLCAAVLIWMLGIGFLSAQTSARSYAMSTAIISRMVELIYPDFQNKPIEQQKGIIESLQYVTRKTAHVFLYMVLGALCPAALYYFGVPLKYRVILSVIICVAFALTDELHQLFVPGRSGQVIDIFIDSFGAVIGIILFGTLQAYRRKKLKSQS
jgi:VanZ family protein